MGYQDTFISVAPDSTAEDAKVPRESPAKVSVACAQYEMLVDEPYHHTEEDVIFATSIRNEPDLAASEQIRRRDELFAKPQACLRASPLPKKFGWGLSLHDKGGVALVAMESEANGRRVEDADDKVMKAMRSKRA